MTDMELKELCKNLLLALHDGEYHPNVEELHNTYGGKDIKAAFDELCINGYLNTECISAQLTNAGECFITTKGNLNPFTVKGTSFIAEN